MTTIETITSKVDFSRRYNRVFFDQHQLGDANFLFNTASEEIDGTFKMIEDNGLDARDLWVSHGADGTRKVTLSRSMNGKWSVSMENIEAS